VKRRLEPWLFAAVTALPAIVLGCASPAGIRAVDAREVHRTLTANVLTTGAPSVPSRQVLQRMGLRDLFEQDPAAAVTAIQVSQLTGGRVFALAELSFWLGEQTGDRTRYLSAAVYAWAFLFPGGAGTPPLPTDPRARLACDLYNRGIAREKLEASAWNGERVELEWSGWQLGRCLRPRTSRCAGSATATATPGSARRWSRAWSSRWRARARRSCASTSRHGSRCPPPRCSASRMRARVSPPARSRRGSS